MFWYNSEEIRAQAKKIHWQEFIKTHVQYYSDTTKPISDRFNDAEYLYDKIYNQSKAP